MIDFVNSSWYIFGIGILWGVFICITFFKIKDKYFPLVKISYPQFFLIMLPFCFLANPVGELIKYLLLKL